ncbi:MAG: ArsR/SmtB family transcription factor [Hyphomicrobiales bacterium]
MEHLLTGLRAVGERTRLRILFVLSHGELTVKELTLILNQSQPRVSRHIRLMDEAGLVRRYREGSWVFLRLSEHGRVGALARMIVELLPGDDEVLRDDLKRLEKVRKARNEKAALHFDAIAGDWDRIRSLHVSEKIVEKAMADAVGSDKIEMLVDAGTGTGRVLEMFAPLAQSAIGIDASHEMLSIARARLEQSGLKHAQVRQGDIYNLPFSTGTADLVTIHQVLHFLDDPAASLAEAARVLKPGGRMLIVDFAPHELEFLREEQAHRRLGITLEQMERWAERAGLSISAYESMPPDLEIEGGLTVSLWVAERKTQAADAPAVMST